MFSELEKWHIKKANENKSFKYLFQTKPISILVVARRYSNESVPNKVCTMCKKYEKDWVRLVQRRWYRSN